MEVVILGSTLGTYIKPAHRPISCWQHSLWPQPGTSTGETRLSLPGIIRYTNKFLCEAAQKGAVDLTYTPASGIDCDWLKVVFVKEVSIFSAFYSLCCCSACLSGTVFVVALSKSVHKGCVPYQALTLVPGIQSQSIRPFPVPCQVDGSKVSVSVYLGTTINKHRILQQKTNHIRTETVFILFPEHLKYPYIFLVKCPDE